MDWKPGWLRQSMSAVHSVSPLVNMSELIVGTKESCKCRPLSL